MPLFRPDTAINLSFLFSGVQERQTSKNVHESSKGLRHCSLIFRSSSIFHICYFHNYSTGKFRLCQLPTSELALSSQRVFFNRMQMQTANCLCDDIYMKVPTDVRSNPHRNRSTSIEQNTSALPHGKARFHIRFKIYKFILRPQGSWYNMRLFSALARSRFSIRAAAASNPNH